MSDPLVCVLHDDAPRPIREVGGKAASLSTLLEAGLPVPPATVLTTAFFAPWLDALRDHDAWRALEDAPPERWSELCPEVQRAGLGFALSEVQQEALERATATLHGEVFAVRSSSPEEDQVGASFAGGYVTRLGVPRDELEPAVRACFVSCLDARVLHYKHRHGLDPMAPSIAVVVQEQIDADVAGVGFSLHPVSNDYDEAVFDASWGLGESVVSGSVTPDHFVLDRATGEVLHRAMGAKERSMHLTEPTERRGWRSDEWCLEDAQLERLRLLIDRVEGLYARPVDIEWALAGEDLYLLQARPITAWVPLPDELKTPRGEPRRLYMDVSLSGGLTINAPITPMGQSWFERFLDALFEMYLRPLPSSIGREDRLWFLSGGRMYQDLSGALWMGTPKLLARGQRSSDVLMSRTLGAIDAKRYRSPRPPKWLRPWALLVWLRAVWRLRRALARALSFALRPERGRVALEEADAAFARTLEGPRDLDAWITDHAEAVVRHVFEWLMPGLGIGVGLQMAFERLAGAPRRDLAQRATRGFAGNVVVEMSAALHRLGQAFPEGASVPQARGRLTTDPAAEAAWQAFTSEYGWRGPHEVDLGRPRYSDQPELALAPALAMRDGEDPAARHAREVEGRLAAWEALQREVWWPRRVVLRWAYRRIEAFVSTRDHPKHAYLRYFGHVRRAIEARGEVLAGEGRLGSAAEVFDLRLEDLDAPPDVDLRDRARSHRAFLDQLDLAVRAFPLVIDSRGRIQRPDAGPGDQVPGVFRGMAVSSGVARGAARVVHAPDEGAVGPGDVLVAHTTDPGWTPLFIGVEAVVLEVGGVLQHGAVVAREYGLPCVVGIPDVFDAFHDGQRIEVDGTEGVVRVLDEEE
jgi:pyruvate,water dikinase